MWAVVWAQLVKELLSVAIKSEGTSGELGVVPGRSPKDREEVSVGISTSGVTLPESLTF